MKRPYFVHFYAIEQQTRLNIKGNVGLFELGDSPYTFRKGEAYSPQRPITTFKRFSKKKFHLRIEGEGQNGERLFSFINPTDHDGRFEMSLSKETYKKELRHIKVYEISYYFKVEIFLGLYIPLKIPLSDFKMVISDFDKTLVETQYSNSKEIYKSLTTALTNFPTVTVGLSKVKELIQQGYLPFILSASPHFYEEAIRDWLYQQRIFNAEIFLKDFRKIFSLFGYELNTKDVAIQGFYKLRTILAILKLTGIPHHLTLIGDSFESDPLIYSTLLYLFDKNYQEEEFIFLLKNHPIFRATNGQLTDILDLLQSLRSYQKIKGGDQEIVKIKVFIRKKENPRIQEEEIIPAFLKVFFHNIIFLEEI